VSDEAGLAAAYRNTNGFYHDGNTLFIAGSRSSRDWLNNPKLAVGKVDSTPRYHAAQEMLTLYPDTTRLVGHSLGGSVAKNLANTTGRNYEIYAAPAVTWSDDPHSHRHWGDPVSMFDRGAHSTFRFGDPHSYRP